MTAMTRLEILTLLYSLEALLEEGKAEKANEIIMRTCGITLRLLRIMRFRGGTGKTFLTVRPMSDI